MAEATQIQSADLEPKPGFIGAIKETYSEFSNDDVLTQSAALAFYSGLAMAPMLTLAVWVTQLFAGNEAKNKIVDAFKQIVGEKAAAPISDLLNPASDQAAKGLTFAGIFSLVLLAISASGVFGQLQSALNTIWHVKAKPSSGIMGFVRKRFLSLGMLFSILFLLMTSMMLSMMLGHFWQFFGGTTMVLSTIAEVAVSFGLFVVLFACLFKYVPDAKIDWHSVWIGGVISALLFTIGKYALGFYLGRTDYSSSYGVAVGSFVALLVWVYYSAVIVLIGAEATEVYARRSGHALVPSEHAVRVEQPREEH